MDSFIRHAKRTAHEFSEVFVFQHVEPTVDFRGFGFELQGDPGAFVVFPGRIQHKAFLEPVDHLRLPVELIKVRAAPPSGREPQGQIHVANLGIAEAVHQCGTVGDIAFQRLADHRLAKDLIFEVEGPHDESIDFRIGNQFLRGRDAADTFFKSGDLPGVQGVAGGKVELFVARCVKQFDRHLRAHAA